MLIRLLVWNGGNEVIRGTDPHNSSIRDLINIQLRISEKALKSIEQSKAHRLKPTIVLGLDAAYSRKYGGVAVASLVQAESCNLIEYGVAVGEPRLEYIPGLLAFREAALFYAATEGLSYKNYDVIVVDGHGISHPRYAGIATHMGLALAKPSIGVAKKKLYGEFNMINERSSCIEYPCVIGELRDPKRDIVLAYVVIPKSRDKNPIYISPGAFISIENALNIILSMLRASSSKLPCPTHYSDKLSKRIARELDKGIIRPESLKHLGLGTLDKYIHRLS